MHAQHRRKQRPVADALGNTQRPAGPPRGSAQLLLREQVPECYPEGHPGLGQQSHGLRFGVPGGDAGFQPGDQRPQFAGRVGGTPALAGNVG